MPAEKEEQNLAPAFGPGIILGTDLENNPVHFAEEERCRGFYVLGQSGTGKSTLIHHSIMQDAHAGTPVVVLDPHADLVSGVMKHLDSAQNVILLDPTDAQSPFGLNLFACPDPEDPLASQRTIDSVMQIFLKLWGPGTKNSSWGPQLEDILRHIVSTFVGVQEYTLVDVPPFLERADFRAKVLEGADSEEQDYWRDSYEPHSTNLQVRAPVLNKVRKFTDNKILRCILGQSKSTIELGRIIETPGCLLLVKLPFQQIGEETASLLGTLIVSQLTELVLLRANREREARTPLALYADEYHLFATPDFNKLFSEGRKFGVMTTVAHQHRSQLDRESRDTTANVPNKAIFRVKAEDGAELKRELTYKLPPPPNAQRIPDSPVDFLVEHGNPHPAIQELIRKFLEPASESQQWQQKQKNGYLDANERSWVQSLGVIDDYLFDQMEGREAGAQETLVRLAQTLAYCYGLNGPSEVWRAHLGLVLSGLVERLLASQPASQAFAPVATLYPEADPGLAEFLALLIQCGRILKKNVLVEPAYNLARYGEKEIDLAQFLSNQLRDFHALTKIGHQGRVVEHLVRIERIKEPPPQTLESWPERVKAIESHAHRTYTRARDQVEAEIRRRQTGGGETPKQQPADGPKVRPPSSPASRADQSTPPQRSRQLTQEELEAYKPTEPPKRVARKGKGSVE
jgi:hypothetical protein